MLASVLRVLGQRREETLYLVREWHFFNYHCRELMAVQPAGQLTQHRVPGVGGGSLYEEFLVPYTNSQLVRVLEQRLEGCEHPFRHGLERRMPNGIHDMAMNPDRQLDQEFAEFS